MKKDHSKRRKHRATFSFSRCQWLIELKYSFTENRDGRVVVIVTKKEVVSDVRLLCSYDLTVCFLQVNTNCNGQ